MIADDGITPILMDFGSAVKARIQIDNRSQALLQHVRATLFPCIVISISVVVGYRRGTKHDGIPCTRTVRCENRRHS